MNQTGHHRPRPRHYVSPLTLALMRPVLCYSLRREAYVLRLIGNHVGPVLRRDYRRGQLPYDGPERREPTLHGLVTQNRGLITQSDNWRVL
jgi:hypothetical protein